MDKKELWLKLKNYHFDHIVSPGLWDHITSRFGKADPSFRAFAGKIARKHGWKTHFALRALNEYKKFIYLGLVSDFLVTPSKIIDVVWHEHLLFSKAYRDFCNEVIEQPFDHYPELVPAEEQTGRFSAQYLDTIELYQAEFGLEPPVDIWGDTKFDKEQVRRNGYQSAKKKRNDNSSDSGSSTLIILHHCIPILNQSRQQPIPSSADLVMVILAAAEAAAAGVIAATEDLMRVVMVAVAVVVAVEGVIKFCYYLFCSL